MGQAVVGLWSPGTGDSDLSVAWFLSHSRKNDLNLTLPKQVLCLIRNSTVDFRGGRLDALVSIMFWSHTPALDAFPLSEL